MRIHGKRRWVGLRVWIADPDGNRQNGTLWWEDEASALIRQYGVVGLQVLPKATEGVRWGLPDDIGKTT